MKILFAGKKTYEAYLNLENTGFDIKYIENEEDKVLHPEEYEIIVCNSLFLHNDIKDFSSLKYIIVISAGLDRIPLDYCKEKGIKVYRNSDTYNVPIAEYVVGEILNFYKPLFHYNQKQKDHIWGKEFSSSLLQFKKVLIVGCGKIGNAIAKRIKAFETIVYGIDVMKEYIDEEIYDKTFLIKSLKQAVKEVDIVIICVPLTNETRELFNEEIINAMNKQCLLVNIARGGIINENALINCLKNHQIAGAILDVFKDEPLKHDSLLWDLDNVIITPHISYYSDEIYSKTNEYIETTIRSIKNKD